MTEPAQVEKADSAAWLAVAAGVLGALMATFDISIVNSSLPIIQGEIGASGTEGTWISTGYLVSEIVIIPLSAWLSRLLGLRTFLLIAAGAFTVFSIVCGLSTSLVMMIVGRVGQGLTGGALIPTAMTIIATRLPRSQQPVGNAMFGATALLGPVIGPLIGGWLTENYSWHYAFFVNVPICFALITLLLVALPHEDAKLDLIGEADWLGIIGLSAGLGALTVVLEEGQRLQWFDSGLIIGLSIVSALGFSLLFLGQMTADRPVIRLQLLANWQFSSVVLMSMVVAMVGYGTAYAIPQFLSGVANYNAIQSGFIVMLSGLPMALMMPFTPMMLRTLDIRLAVGVGLGLLALSAFVETDISPLSSGEAFIWSQVMRGIGTTFAGMFLNQAAIRSVSPQEAGDASGVYNAARNLGGSLALAAFAVLQDQRVWLHSRRLEESVRANSPLVQDYLSSRGGAPGGSTSVLQGLEQVIQLQASVMTFADMFWLLTVCITAVIPLVLILRPLPMLSAKSSAEAAVH
jgi:MFS transporter, DHA2 family, multidrug resistance protein